MSLPLGTKEILNSLDFFIKGKKILDIGLGDGDASKYFVEKGLDVYATGIDIDSYNLSKKLKENIQLKESFVTKLDYPNNYFDYIWASHILEHEINPGLALQEIKRVLKEGGVFIICLPPYKTKIVGGHINTGYTIGQLMYQLLLNNFSIRQGKFIKYGYNICGIVKKDSSIKLPKLRYDEGDIEVLSDFFPIKVRQGFEGNIKKINWEHNLPILNIIKGKIKTFLYKKYKKIKNNIFKNEK